MIKLPILDIYVPDETSREVDDSHVDLLFRKMVMEGFQTSAVGCITVVSLPYQSSGSRYYIVDGLHRRRALLRCKEKGVERLASVVDNVPVQEAQRPDGEKMTMEDMLYLSQRLNELVHTVLPTTVRDRIHAIISIYNCNVKYARPGERTVADMPASQVANWFFQRHFSGILKKSTVSSIVNVALNMRRSPRTYAAYKASSGRKENEVGISLLILKDTAFTRAEDRASELMVKCIHYRNVQLLPTFGRVPSFDLRTYLTYIQQYYEVIREMARASNLSTEDIADLEDLESDGTDMIPTWKSVYKRMIQYEEEPVPRKPENQEARLESFRSVLRDRFGIQSTRQVSSESHGRDEEEDGNGENKGVQDKRQGGEPVTQAIMQASQSTGAAQPATKTTGASRHERRLTQFEDVIMEPLPIPISSDDVVIDETVEELPSTPASKQVIPETSAGSDDDMEISKDAPEEDAPEKDAPEKDADSPHPEQLGSEDENRSEPPDAHSTPSSRNEIGADGAEDGTEVQKAPDSASKGASKTVSNITVSRIPRDSTTPRPFPCSLGDYCAFPGSAAVHKCTACGINPVHNLCDYARVHHLIPRKYLAAGERDMVFVCSRKCYDGGKDGDPPSWKPPAGVTEQEAWEGDDFNPYAKASSSTDSVEKPQQPSEPAPQQTGAKRKFPSSPGAPPAKRRAISSPQSLSFPSRLTRSKARSAAIAEHIASLDSPSTPSVTPRSASGTKKTKKAAIALKQVKEGNDEGGSMDGNEDSGEEKEDEDQITPTRLQSKGFKVHRYEDQQPEPPSFFTSHTSVEEAASMVRSISSLLHPEHRSGFHVTEGEVEEFQQDIESVAGDTSSSRLVYFERARARLDSLGYVVLDGILQPSELSSTIHKLLDSFCNMFVDGQDGAWGPILNSGSSDQDARGGPDEQRFMTPCKAVVEDLEKDSTSTLARDKAALDVFFAIIAEKLHLEDSTPSLDGFEKGPKLQFGKTGLRLLLTGSRCERQVPHLDFVYPGPPLEDENRFNGTPIPFPDYSFIATGAMGTPLIVRPRSHAFLNAPHRSAAAIFPLLKPELVWIPPYSVIVCRGDLEHSGPGWKDHELMKTKLGKKYKMVYPHHIRAHTMAIRETSVLVNDLVYAPLKDSRPVARPDMYELPHDVESDTSSSSAGSSGEDYMEV